MLRFRSVKEDQSAGLASLCLPNVLNDGTITSLATKINMARKKLPVLCDGWYNDLKRMVRDK